MTDTTAIILSIGIFSTAWIIAQMILALANHKPPRSRRRLKRVKYARFL